MIDRCTHAFMKEEILMYVYTCVHLGAHNEFMQQAFGLEIEIRCLRLKLSLLVCSLGATQVSIGVLGWRSRCRRPVDRKNDADGDD